MSSLRLALKLSMEESHGDKKAPALVPTPKPPVNKNPKVDKDGAGARKKSIPNAPSTNTLAELQSYKMHRKNSRLSDTHSVTSEDSKDSSGSISVTLSIKKHSGDDLTPVKENPRKRALDKVSPNASDTQESPAVSEAETAGKTLKLPRLNSIDELEADDTSSLKIDLGAVRPDIDRPQNMDSYASAPEDDAVGVTEEAVDVSVDQKANFRTPKSRSESVDMLSRRRSGSDGVRTEDEEGATAEAGGADEMTPRHRRAAALMAQSKLISRKPPDEKEHGEKEQASDDTAGVAANSEGDQRAAGKTPKTSRGSRRSGGSGRGQQRRGTAAEELSHEVDMNKYALCDNCEKWRRLPSHVDTNELPEKWICSMNVWDSERNNCDAPEEVFADTSKSGTSQGDDNNKEENDGLDGAANLDEEETAGARSKNRSSGGRIASRNVIKRRRIADGEDNEEGAEYENKKRPNKAMKSSNDLQSPVVGTLVKDQWVQCDKCEKWRKVAADINPDDLPKVWYCTMNTWAPAYARCGVRQEKTVERHAGTLTSDADDQTNLISGRGKYSRKQGSDKNEAPIAATAEPGAPIKKVTQWVQCERNNCQKWRKVSAQISMESLPDKWFCEMNTWDTDRATCDAPEEDASDIEAAGAGGISTQLIVGNCKGANALSYRRLIFSQDGRLRPVYSEKNKFGFGIFSHSEVHNAADNEDYIAPTRSIGYWWSSLYDEETGSNYCTGSKKHPAVGGTGSKKDQAVRDGDIEKRLLDQRNAYEIVDDRTVVSTREYWPRPVRQQSLPLETEDSITAVASWHMINSFRRLCDLPSPAIPRPVNKLLAKNISRLCQMPVQDIIRSENMVVRSCLSFSVRDMNLFGNDEGKSGESYSKRPISAVDGTGCVSISSLWSTIQNANFLDDNEEACRACMTVKKLKDAIHRLEEADLLRVTISAVGELCITPLQSISTIIRARKSSLAMKEVATANCSKPSMVLVQEDLFDDKLYGTDLFWARCGETTVISVPVPTPIVTSDLPPPANGEGICDMIDGSETIVESPSATEIKMESQKVAFGPVRPPLKLRKLMKPYYCVPIS